MITSRFHHFGIAAFAALAATTTMASAAADSDAQQTQEVARWLAGSFSNRAQADRDPAFHHGLGDRFGLAKQDANEGVFALEQGRALVALERLRRANEAFDQLGLQQETAMTLFDMAQANAELGRLAEQRAMHASALAVYGVLNDDYGKLRTQARQMYAAYLSGEFRSGLSAGSGLLLDARRLGYPTVEAEIHLYQGLLLGGQLRWPESATELELARTVYAQAQAHDGAGEAARALALVLARQGKAEQALALLGPQDGQAGEANAYASDLLARGDVLSALGREREAFATWQRAHEFAGAHAIDSVRIAAAIAMGNQRVDRHELDQAQPLVGELTRDGAETYEAERLRARYLAATKPGAAAAAWQRVEALRGERAAEPAPTSSGKR